MKTIFTFFVFILACYSCNAKEITKEREYRTGGPQFTKVWHTFYVEGHHEPELDDPLIAAGRPMTSAICQAILHPDMKRRRYAIGALGYIGDKRALPTLVKILKNKREISYFRADALRAIYQIDMQRGTQYAKQFAHKTADADVKTVADAIHNKEAWLTQPSEEHHSH